MAESNHTNDQPTHSWAGTPGSVDPPADLRLSTRWRLERPVGQGGQGQVWLAHDREADQAVAIKVLRQDLSPEAREYLRRAAEAAPKTWFGRAALESLQRTSAGGDAHATR